MSEKTRRVSDPLLQVDDDSEYVDDPELISDNDTAQLADSDPADVAGAAAIISSKKRKTQPHTFESNRAVKNQRTLLNLMKSNVNQWAAATGGQAVIFLATPDNPAMTYKIFGTKPLEGVIKNLQGTITEDLENALAQCASASLFELPRVTLDGLVIPVEQMTQQQLRAFIPLMLKFSIGTDKQKLNYDDDSMKPPWWPEGLAWANLGKDNRSKDEQKKMSWTDVMKNIVLTCYKYHGREDLLPRHTKTNKQVNVPSTSNTTSQYVNTVVHTIDRSDGITKLIEVESLNPITTLPGGTTVKIPKIPIVQTGQIPVHTTQTISENASQGEVIELNSWTEATVAPDGQLILIREYDCATSNSDGSVYVPIPEKDPNDEDDMQTLAAVPSGSTTQSSSNEDPLVLQVLSFDNASGLTKAMETIDGVQNEENGAPK